MVIGSGIEVNNVAICNNLKRITNQIYKLLPNREEKIDWQTPLSTIIEELSGMSELLPQEHEILFSLLCKLKGKILRRLLQAYTGTSTSFQDLQPNLPPQGQNRFFL